MKEKQKISCKSGITFIIVIGQYDNDGRLLDLLVLVLVVVVFQGSSTRFLFVPQDGPGVVRWTVPPPETMAQQSRHFDGRESRRRRRRVSAGRRGVVLRDGQLRQALTDRIRRYRSDVVNAAATAAAAAAAGI